MISWNDPFFGALAESEADKVVGDGFAGATLAPFEVDGFSFNRAAASGPSLRWEEADGLDGCPFGRLWPEVPVYGRAFEPEEAVDAVGR